MKISLAKLLKIIFVGIKTIQREMRPAKCLSRLITISVLAAASPIISVMGDLVTNLMEYVSNR